MGDPDVIEGEEIVEVPRNVVLDVLEEAYCAEAFEVWRKLIKGTPVNNELLPNGECHWCDLARCLEVSE